MLMMMWVRYSWIQMMTRKIMRHKVIYTIKVHGQGGQGGRDLSLRPPFEVARRPRAPPAALPAVPASSSHSKTYI